MSATEIKIEGATRDLFRLVADRIDAEAKAGRPLIHADVWLLQPDPEKGQHRSQDRPNADLHGLAFLDFGA